MAIAGAIKIQIQMKMGSIGLFLMFVRLIVRPDR